MEAHYNQTWVKLMPTMRQAHPSGKKSRYYPDAPQDKPYTMDFTPGFDISKSRYALREPSNYGIGVNPFAARNDQIPKSIITKIEEEALARLDPTGKALAHVNQKLYDREKVIRRERESQTPTVFQRDAEHQSHAEIHKTVPMMIAFLESINEKHIPHNKEELDKIFKNNKKLNTAYYEYALLQRIKDKRSSHLYQLNQRQKAMIGMEGGDFEPDFASW